MKMPRLHLNQDGLAMFLGGELQVAVYLQVLDNPGILRDVHGRMQHTYRQGVAYTTVATVANKLCDKGILKRERHSNGRDYTYTALIDENTLIEIALALIVRKLYNEYKETLQDTIEEAKGQADV